MGDLKYFNKAINLLSQKKSIESKKLDFLDCPATFDDFKKISHKFIHTFLNNININKIFNYIITKKNINYGIFTNYNNEIKAILPPIETNKDILIWIHELTHLINLLFSKNNIFNSIYTEIIPVFNEVYFIYKSNEDYEIFINRLINEAILKLKKCNAKDNSINDLAHIYAYLIVNDLTNENLDYCFNYLNNININSNNLSYDLEKNGFLLTKNSLKKL